MIDPGDGGRGDAEGARVGGAMHLDISENVDNDIVIQSIVSYPSAKGVIPDGAGYEGGQNDDQKQGCAAIVTAADAYNASAVN